MNRVSRRHCLQTLAALSAWPVAAQTTGPQRGSPSLQTPLSLSALPWLSGGVWTPDSAAGRVTVLYWWASWCPICAAQTPDMQALHTRHAEAGLSVVGLSVDRTLDAAQAHWQTKGWTFPSLWLAPGTRDTFTHLPSGVPTVWVYNREQRLVQVEPGRLSPAQVQRLDRWL